MSARPDIFKPFIADRVLEVIPVENQPFELEEYTSTPATYQPAFRSSPSKLLADDQQMLQFSW
jgi:hypothetical protein